MSSGAPRRSGGSRNGGGRSSASTVKGNTTNGNSGRGGGNTSNVIPNNNNVNRAGRIPRRGPGRPKGRSNPDESTSSSGTTNIRDEV
jgi:hypothetical protein